MPSDLPADILSRACQIILPLITDADDREALLTEAFYLYDPLLYRIKREGNPKTFSVMCVKTLLDHGCLNDGEHALARLLMTARIDCGFEKHPEIDALIDLVNGLCRETRLSALSSSPSSQPAASPLLETPIQTLATPRDERQATVFISYSHRDTEFAKRLIAALSAVGHACWIDTSEIKGGDEWIMTIAEGINNSYAFVPIVTRQALESRWVQDEILWARQKNKLIIPAILEDVFGETRFFPLVSFQGVAFFDKDEAAAAAQLLSYLPRPTVAGAEVSEASAGETPDDNIIPVTTSAPRSIPRTLELDYLERLRLEELLNTEKYTALGGLSQQKQRTEMRAVFELLPMSQNRESVQETRRFENAVSEIRHLKRAVLLGEPGGGKTTTLWKLAADLVNDALNDRAAPIPLLIRLGKWTEDNQTLESFIISQIGALGEYLDVLLNEKRAALLLDGLNELPVRQRESKYPQVRRFIQKNPSILAVVSCRELDYTLDLGFDKITITPLDPIRIREFVTRYMGQDKGEDLFWRLAGQKMQEYHTDFTKKVGASYEREFWVANTLPNGVIWTYNWDDKNNYNPYWTVWLQTRDHPSGLMALARNPYMLLMFTSIYAETDHLPANRGQLFRTFVTTLLKREHIPSEDLEPLMQGLARVAYTMQSQTADEEGSVLTVLPQEEVKVILGERDLYLAGSASILSVGAQVRFTHQLLQEYFAATYMDLERQAGRLKAETLWSKSTWWERTNWEEAAILLAGLYSDDPTPIVLWLKDAQPEIAAQCITRSGSALPLDAILVTLRENWLPRLTPDIQREAEARAAVGRALGQLTLADGTLLDNRRGVGVLTNGLPDIEWIPICSGVFIYGTDNKTGYPEYAPPADQQNINLPGFEMSKYPITYAQYQTFIDDFEGFRDGRWWEGLGDHESCRRNQAEPGEQEFKYTNHPRENVSWYDAMAFCRWCSWRIGGVYALDKANEWLVRLPTQQEWEKAARGQEGQLYPYGNEFEATKANTSEMGIRQTSAVGIFPEGASPYGVEELSGNVWEWCLKDYSEPAREESTREFGVRVLRGGSYHNDHDSARALFRFYQHPHFRFSAIGFRVARSFGEARG